MKKLAIILVILCLMVAAIPAGAENEKDWMLGRWTVSSVADLDAEGNITASYAPEEFGVERDLYFWADGTGYFTIYEYGTLKGASPFQWSQDAASPYELAVSQGFPILYDESSKEIKIPSGDGVEALFYRKTDWPVQKPPIKEAEKIEDYYGQWKLCGLDLSKTALGFNGLLDSKLFDTVVHSYIVIEENNLHLYQYGSLFGEKINYAKLPEPRVKDGSLQIKVDNQYIDLETVENGWILFPYSGMDMYFEKMDDSIPLEQVLEQMYQDAARLVNNSSSTAP